jgi:hypothetical protein
MTIQIQVIRPDDLLVLTFAFDGFNLVADGTRPAELVRVPGSDATLIVSLPPQCLVERVYFDDEASAFGGFGGEHNAPAFVAGPSRLGFRIPAQVARLRLDLETLLNWGALLPIGALLIPPPASATVIEVPWRLNLTTLPGSTWKHRARLAQSARVALWQTELLNATETLRIGSSPDLDAHFDSFRVPLSSAERRDLALLSEQGFKEAELRLSALGADFRARAEFVAVQGTALRRWSHVTTLGRDQYKQTETEGTLFPFGHRATLVETVERSFKRNTALLTFKRVLILLEAKKQYDTRDWPFTSVEFAVPLGVPLPVTSDPADTSQFVLPALATDKAGKLLSLQLPVRCVAVNSESVADAASRYGNRETELNGQPVAYVASTGADDAGEFPTLAMRFRAITDGASFRPVMQEALAEIEAIEALTRLGSRASFRYDPGFVANGFPGGDGVRQYAQLIESVPVQLGSAQLGGLGAPSLLANSLSLGRGISVPERLDPQAIAASFSGKLLGILDLRLLLDAGSAAQKLPQLRVVRRSDGREIEFKWRIALKGAEPKPMLDLNGTLPLNRATRAKLTGTLTDFPIAFAGLATLWLTKVTFTQESGQSSQISELTSRLEFTGKLEFLAKIAEKFAQAMPGAKSGVHTRIDTQGVEVSVEHLIPVVPMGPFLLSNLGLGAAIKLNFNAAATLRFGLSSRRNPFLVSYSAFGGGGYFAIELDATGPICLEAAIELGAVAEVNFGIVKAVAHVLIGIYFSLKERQAEIAGYVRVHGAVELLGIVTIGVDLQLRLSYSDGVVKGRAEVTVFVQVFGFSRSVTLSVEREFDTRDVLGGGEREGNVLPRNARFEDAITLEQWTAYRKAFA